MYDSWALVWYCWEEMVTGMWGAVRVLEMSGLDRADVGFFPVQSNAPEGTVTTAYRETVAKGVIRKKFARIYHF